MSTRSQMINGEYAVVRHVIDIENKGRGLLSRVRAQQNETNKLISLTSSANVNLFEARTVSLMILFSDTLKIDMQKLTVVHNEFFRTSHTASIQLQDIMNVQSDLGPLFGSMTITSKHYLNNTQTLKYLKRKDVIKAQRLIQGFMIAHRANIDTENIDTEKLILLLNELGQENHSI